MNGTPSAAQFVKCECHELTSRMLATVAQKTKLTPSRARLVPDFASCQQTNRSAGRIEVRLTAFEDAQDDRAA